LNTKSGSKDWSTIWDRVRGELNNAGIDLETMGVRIEELGGKLGHAVKVVFVAPDLQESVDAMNREQRDQVIMVRVDEATLRQLDAWVKTEAVKSRSEAAAVFIREGLKMRQSELEKLEDALADVDRARERLQEKVKEVFGEKAPPAS
jgi:Arc/MetJ-type ribon-helix-helix transcriptional regulator